MVGNIGAASIEQTHAYKHCSAIYHLLASTCRGCLHQQQPVLSDSDSSACDIVHAHLVAGCGDGALLILEVPHVDDNVPQNEKTAVAELVVKHRIAAIEQESVAQGGLPIVCMQMLHIRGRMTMQLWKDRSPTSIAVDTALAQGARCASLVVTGGPGELLSLPLCLRRGALAVKLVPSVQQTAVFD